MGKKQSLSTEEQAQIITLSNLNFSIHQIAKKMKVSKTVLYNVSMSMSQLACLLAKFFFIA